MHRQSMRTAGRGEDVSVRELHDSWLQEDAAHSARNDWNRVDFTTGLSGRAAPSRSHSEEQPKDRKLSQGTDALTFSMEAFGAGGSLPQLHIPDQSHAPAALSSHDGSSPGVCGATTDTSTPEVLQQQSPFGATPDFGVRELVPHNEQLQPLPELFLPPVNEAGEWRATFSGECGSYEEAPTSTQQGTGTATDRTLNNRDKRKLPASDTGVVPAAGEFAALHAQQESDGGRSETQPPRRQVRTRQGPEETPEFRTSELDGCFLHSHGVVRSRSKEYAIDPGTGRAVKYGPALTSQLNTVELPGIRAMFQLAKNASKNARQLPFSDPVALVTCADERFGERSSSVARHELHAAPHLWHRGDLAALCSPAVEDLGPEQPLNSACWSQDVQPVAFTEPYFLAVSPFQATAPEASHSSLPMSAIHPVNMPEVSHFSRQTAYHSAPAFRPPPAVPDKVYGTQGCRVASRSSATQLRQRGCKSIVSGVLQAAKSCNDQGVYRIEEMHQQTQLSKDFKGVRREPWGIVWTAFIPATAARMERALGTFQDPETAARAHDVALMRLDCSTPDEDLNFPRADYDEKQLQDVRQAPVAEFLATLHKFGAFGDRRSSRFQGVVKSGKKNFQAWLPADEGA